MEEDLKLGKLNAMVYWYPQLVLKLYAFSYDGLDFRGYLSYLNEDNTYFFEEIFKTTTKKLDDLREKTIQNNHLGEIKFKKGKIG